MIGVIFWSFSVAVAAARMKNKAVLKPHSCAVALAGSYVHAWRGQTLPTPPQKPTADYFPVQKSINLMSE